MLDFPHRSEPTTLLVQLSLMLIYMFKPRLHIQSVEARFGVIRSKLTSRYAESVQESVQNYAIVLDLTRMTIMPQPPLAHAKGYLQYFTKK